ncbi:MAG: hypothetical protein QXR81_07625 [Candidatus Nezhaarchaeales archaeon]
MARCELCGGEGKLVSFVKGGVKGYVELKVCEKCLRILMGDSSRS